MPSIKVCDSAIATPARRKSLANKEPMPAHERAVVDAALAILERYMTAPKRTTLQSPQAIKDYLRLTLGQEQREVFAMLFFNTQCELLAYEPMFAGSLVSTMVYPREVLLRTLHHRATGVVLSHNHPSGNSEPSHADVQMTEKIIAILGFIDVQVLDHVIVSGTAAFSMREAGMLPV